MKFGCRLVGNSITSKVPILEAIAAQTERLLWGYAVVRQENGAIARSVEELWVQLGQGEVKVEVMEVKD